MNTTSTSLLTDEPSIYLIKIIERGQIRSLASPTHIGHASSVEIPISNLNMNSNIMAEFIDTHIMGLNLIPIELHQSIHRTSTASTRDTDGSSWGTNKDFHINLSQTSILNLNGQSVLEEKEEGEEEEGGYIDIHLIRQEHNHMRE